jgi:hypothetical protein
MLEKRKRKIERDRLESRMEQKVFLASQDIFENEIWKQENGVDRMIIFESV